MAPPSPPLNGNEYGRLSYAEKVEYLEKRTKVHSADMDEKIAQLNALQRRYEASNADAYEFQKKAQALESEAIALRGEVHRLKSDLPRENQKLVNQLKRQQREFEKLQTAVQNKEGAIEELRRRHAEDKRHLDLEIRALDEEIEKRNQQNDVLKEEKEELGLRVKTLEHHVDIEKRTADSYKSAAEKYDLAGPALERLNKILAKYLGEQLQDGMDWPPGHPNNKMNKALTALEDELAKANKRPSLPAAGPTSAPAPHSPTPSEIQFKTPNFRASKPHQAQTLADQVQSALQAEGSDDEISLNDTPSIREKKSVASSFKAAMANAFKGKSRDHENEFIPESPLFATFHATPKDKQRPGVDTNTGKRNFSLFGNSVSAPDDDSPKPSEKVFDADDKRRARPGRFAKPEPETVVKYVDREVRVEVPVYVPCTKKHAEDMSPVKPEKLVEYRDREVKVPVPCGKLHADEMAPVKPKTVVEYKDREVKVPVPCKKAHVEDLPPAKPVIEYKTREVKVPVPCGKLHADEMAPVKPKTVVEYKDREVKVPVPCKKAHVEDQPPVKPVIEYKTREVKVPVPCSKAHVEDQPPVQPIIQYKDREVRVEIPIPCTLTHASDVQPEIITKYIDKPVPKYIDRTIYSPRHPLLTILYLYLDVYTCLIDFLQRHRPHYLHWASQKLPPKLSQALIMRHISGTMYELVHQEVDYTSLQSAKHGVLRKMTPAIPPLPSASTSNPGSHGKSKTMPTPPASTVGPTTASKSTTAPTGESYTLLTQYITHRPPFTSNALLSLLFTTLIPLLLASLLIVSEYTSLLQYNGFVSPSWFTFPFQGRAARLGGGGYGGGGWGYAGFTVDRDWSWPVYLWKASTGGWWRELGFWLRTQASGGAGYVMPG